MTEAMSDPTIQLPAAPPEDETGHWCVSLAEIDAMGRKAARGVGLSWGMAEEAGRAARWLAAYGQPGPEALLAALEAMDGDLAAHAPDADWRAAGPLCPVRTGAALSDRAEGLAGTIRLGRVLEPILMAPFLCRAARDLDRTFTLAGDGVELVAAPGGPDCANWVALRGTSAELTVTAGGSAVPRCPAGAGPWRMAVETWRGLGDLAHRTYVPATEASRAGAGAGVRDTD